MPQNKGLFRLPARAAPIEARKGRFWFWYLFSYFFFFWVCGVWFVCCASRREARGEWSENYRLELPGRVMPKAKRVSVCMAVMGFGPVWWMRGHPFLSKWPSVRFIPREDFFFFFSAALFARALLVPKVGLWEPTCGRNFVAAVCGRCAVLTMERRTSSRPPRNAVAQGKRVPKAPLWARGESVPSLRERWPLRSPRESCIVARMSKKLETRVAELERRLAVIESKSLSHPGDSWKELFGWSKSGTLHREAARLGARWRAKANREGK